MRFMVMHKVDAQMEAGVPPSERIISDMGNYVQSSLRSGVFKDGAGLHRSAQRVRVAFDGGKPTVTHGPFQGGNHLLSSFAMVKAKSVDHAVELASRVAAATGDAEIEIGPVVEPWDLPGIGMTKPPNAPLRFLLLRKGDAAYEAGAPQPTGLKTVLDELNGEGVLQTASALAPSNQGARFRKVGGKREWTDGPFTESKELVAGYSIIEVPSQAEARAWAEAYADILGDTEVDVRVVVAKP
jgi:hypothetical protein